MVGATLSLSFAAPPSAGRSAPPIPTRSPPPAAPLPTPGRSAPEACPPGHPDRIHRGTGWHPHHRGTFSFTVKVTDASSQTATKPTSITIAGGLLAITVPSSAALPSAAARRTTGAQLGTVTVTDQRGIASASWTATVTGKTFVTGRATAAETIPLTRVTYWAGPATATTGTGTFTPGQASAAAAVNLAVARTAFSLTSGSSVSSASWNPTLSVSVPAGAVSGTYTATITHSVA